MIDTSLQGFQMKTTKIQYFLWKKANNDAVLIYAPSAATTEGVTYYTKNYGNCEFSKYTWRDSSDPLADIKSRLEKHNYHLVCSLLIPSNHTTKDLAKYYTTIKKNLSL